MFIYIILGIVLGAILVYVILRPKLETTKRLDEKTIADNERIQRQNQELLNLNDKLNQDKEYNNKIISSLEKVVTEKSNNVNALDSIEQEKLNHISSLEKVAEEKMANIESSAELQVEHLKTEYNKLLNNYSKEYLSTLEDYAASATATVKKTKEEITSLNKKLDSLRSVVNAAIQYNLRQQEENKKQDFYRIDLSEIDVQEIKKIREIEPYLRDVTPLNKVIWKSYYETPFNSMIGRVVGKEDKTGIYKLTNLSDGCTYIGQAVNISKRFKEHVKRGIGADTPTKNKLYPAMLKYGAENFTFEILEECAADELDEKEKFWIDYFQSKTVGYNVTAGNSPEK